MTKFLYIEAKEKIIQMIEDGLFDSDERLLSERGLSNKLGYSRMTIKKAFNELSIEGVLIRKKGDGTYLLKNDKSNKFEVGDDSPVSLTQSIRIKGMSSTSFVDSFKLIYNDQKLMKIFPEYYEFYELIRLREANDNIVSIQKAYFPFRVFRDAHRYDFSEYSLYDYMDYKSKRPMTFRKTLRAVRVDEEETFSKINVRNGEFVLCFEYFGYTESGELVEYTESFFDPNKISFKIEIRL